MTRNQKTRLLYLVLFALAVYTYNRLVIYHIPSEIAPGETIRITLNSKGSEANGNSSYPRISADGRLIVFQSTASNLVPGDNNDLPDIFLFDWNENKIERVSKGVNGQESNGKSMEPAISANGRFIVFTSYASNLVLHDMNERGDIFLFDRETEQMELISRTITGEQTDGNSAVPDISGDGRFIVFLSCANNLYYLASCFSPPRFSPISPGNREHWFAYVFDRQYQTVLPVDLSMGRSNMGGSHTGRYTAIADNGCCVAFGYSYNLSVSVLMYQTLTGGTVVRKCGSVYQRTSFSADGTFFACTQRDWDWDSYGPDLGFDIYLYDRQNSTKDITSQNYEEIVSLTSDSVHVVGDSFNPVLSGNGQIILFSSDSELLVAYDTNEKSDIFARNLVTGETIRINVSTGGRQSNGFWKSLYLHPESYDLSFTGDMIVFASDASNLVPGDTNGYSDIFIHRPQWTATEPIPTATPSPAP